MGSFSWNKADKLKAIVGSKFFGLSFTKKSTGERRDMVCLLKCAKYLSLTSRGLSEKQKESKTKNNLLSVYSIHDKGYRTIPCDNIIEVRYGGGKIIKFKANE